jgi:DNA primase
MRFPPSILDDIRQRLPVSAVVGRRVKLTKAGREWKGLSPFNAERTPSFFVNDQKGQFFDFSSGKNGDIFRFVMETEGLSFPEAVERLAGEAGVALPTVSAESVAIEEKRKGLHEVMELAAAFFEAQIRAPVGEAARRYCVGRGLQGAVAAEFRIGYAPPERFALRDHLASKGVSAEQMIDTGLLVHGEEIAVPYDRFRDRVMFPIQDGRGRVIAFGGRALQADVPAKYLNSPETVLFHKGGGVYNHHRARKAAHDAGTVIAVEGYVDVIAMHRAGLAHAVAPLGTALTEEQVALLWRMAPEPILCFDGDKAGRRAAFRAIDVVLPLLSAGKTVRFCFLPGGQDPDDLLRSAGPEALKAAVAQPQSLVDTLWLREFERQPLDTPERRADFERRLKDLASGIGDETIRKYYRADIEERLRALFGAERGGRRAGRQEAGYRDPRAPRRFDPNARRPGEREKLAREMQAGAGQLLRQSALVTGLGARMSAREAALVVAPVHYPALLDIIAEDFAALLLESPAADRLRQDTLDAYAHTGASVGALVLSDRGNALLAEAEAIVRRLDAWALGGAQDAEALRSWQNAADLQLRARALHEELKEAERECGLADTDDSFERIRALRTRLQLLEERGDEDAA